MTVTKRFNSSFCLCSSRQIKLLVNYVGLYNVHRMSALQITCTSFVQHQTKEQIAAVGKSTQTYSSASAVT